MHVDGELGVNLWSDNNSDVVLDEDGFVLKHGSHQIGRLRCIDLYNRWRRDGTMSSKVANDTYWELSQRDNLGFSVQHPHGLNRLVVITFYQFGASNAYHTWYGSYLMRIDTHPNFSLTPLREVDNGDAPRESVDRPSLDTYRGVSYVVTGVSIQKVSPEGRPVGQIVRPPKGAYFWTARGRWIGMCVPHDFDTKPSSTVFDLDIMSFRLMSLARQNKLQVKVDDGGLTTSQSH